MSFGPVAHAREYRAGALTKADFLDPGPAEREAISRADHGRGRYKEVI